MKHQNLKDRTQNFALRIMAFVETLPRSRTADVIGRQLLRSATSVGANYRAACRGKSKADFIAKMGIVEEEADECSYWLELLVRGSISDAMQTDHLTTEANEILAIVIASIRTARNRED